LKPEDLLLQKNMSHKTHFFLLAILCSVVVHDPADARVRDRTPRVDINLANADLRNVLRLFAEVGNVNVVFDEKVGGTVTVMLRRVRWDRALRAILRSKGLGIEREGNILRVARAETLAKERAARLDARRLCRDEGPLHTRLIRPSHARAEELAPLLRAQLKSKRGSVEVYARTNTLVIRDVHCP
jgi:type IV pilus assembly protein PilQ